MKKHKFSLMILFVVILLFGCSDNNVETNTVNEEVAYNYFADAIVMEWKQSPHNNIIEDTKNRNDCLICHDGGGFALQTKEYTDIDYAKPIECMACHDSHANALKNSNSISIPTKDTVIGGQGNLCMSCHNGRGKSTADAPRRAYPHYGLQADVLTGSGGIQLNEWGNLNNTYGHINLDNTCVDCHLVEKDNHLNHSFLLDTSDADIICGRCHTGTDSFDVLAKDDYDGNGQVEGIQKEVEGLMDSLYSGIIKKINNGSFAGEKGAIVFKDSNGNIIDTVSDELYVAAYNYYLIKNDRSYGIHNPLFTVHLLQLSYKNLTGVEIPNAFIVKGDL
jgi:hypothetical protein